MRTQELSIVMPEPNDDSTDSKQTAKMYVEADWSDEKKNNNVPASINSDIMLMSKFRLCKWWFRPGSWQANHRSAHWENSCMSLWPVRACIRHRIASNADCCQTKLALTLAASTAACENSLSGLKSMFSEHWWSMLTSEKDLTHQFRSEWKDELMKRFSREKHRLWLYWLEDSAASTQSGFKVWVFVHMYVCVSHVPTHNGNTYPSVDSFEVHPLRCFFFFRDASGVTSVMCILITFLLSIVLNNEDSFKLLLDVVMFNMYQCWANKFYEYK